MRKVARLSDSDTQVTWYFWPLLMCIASIFTMHGLSSERHQGSCAFVHCSNGKLPLYYWTFRKLLLVLAVATAERGHQLPLFLVFSHLSQVHSSFVLSSICFRFPALITHYPRSKSTFPHPIPWCFASLLSRTVKWNIDLTIYTKSRNVSSKLQVTSTVLG